LQSHLSATGNNPPAPTHQDLEGQQEMAESEAIQNTADMSNPPVIPTSAPIKSKAREFRDELKSTKAKIAPLAAELGTSEIYKRPC
jgi:hypothetical protein